MTLTLVAKNGNERRIPQIISFGVEDGFIWWFRETYNDQESLEELKGFRVED